MALQEGLGGTSNWIEAQTLVVAAPVAVLLLWRMLNAFLRLAHRNGALNQSRAEFSRFTTYLRF